MLFRLIRFLGGLLMLLFLGAVVAGWLAVLRSAQRAALLSLESWGGAVEHGPISARFLPPGAVVNGLVIRAPDGTELVRADRCVLPLPPRAWLGEGKAGSPELEGFRASLLPGGRWSEALAGRVLPGLGDWSGQEGRLTLGGLSLDEVTVTRQGDRIDLQGRMAQAGGRVHLQGHWKPGELSGTLSADRFSARDLSPWIVDPTRSTVRGGSFDLEGKLTLSASALSFDGRLGAREMLIEGHGGEGGPVELALRLGGGSASIPLLYRSSLEGSPDWAAAARVALAAGAPRARHGG